ncbi:unnamed protein product [Darwinula stevensoni]|uniref:Thyroglobulin type-1 domain-containing protein n=1 Tax=Darwinula stevensoni TaxID=69355 RepID=A0A7R8XGH6_9CRUS|nr:unnamed protein product [Darwinula stevensoni]CAG0896018.1 unnamed protein product [Darwinula stevensoni]
MSRILDLVFPFRLCVERTRCWDQRAYAQKVSKDHKMGTFIPECMDDGRFQEVQCHRGTGYCWCVSETGKVIPGSALQYRRPSCARNSLFLSLLLTSLIVPSRHSNYMERYKATRSSGTRDRRKKGCTPTDRSAFNNHLIKIFMTEYQRILQPTTEKASVESVVSNLDQTVLEWKFRELDGNHDGILRRKEYRDLRRLAKKACYLLISKFL